MIIDRLILGNLSTNCYILTINNDCIIIDPADDYEKIKKKVGSKNILGAIVTHHHFDHVGALDSFEDIYDVNNLKEGINTLGPFNFETIYTPGHTDDSICIYFKEENIMFTGDFLFKDGIGRVDLGGNIIDMQNSLVKINTYNEKIIIYPGHGDQSILGYEVKKYL